MSDQKNESQIDQVSESAAAKINRDKINGSETFSQIMEILQPLSTRAAFTVLALVRSDLEKKLQNVRVESLVEL